MADGLLGRWSRLKQEARAGKALDERPSPGPVPAKAAVPNAAQVSQEVAGKAHPTASMPDASVWAEPVEAPRGDAALPTLEQAQALTPESDFKPFVARGVTPEVRNAAMKKLFADPHFNVMDRMDVYIDDYNLSDPIPEAMMRQMASAQFLGLFDEKETDEPKPDSTASPRDVANGSTAAAVAQSQSQPSPDTAPDTRNHDDADPDLRLQPDHAPAAPADRRGAG